MWRIAIAVVVVVAAVLATGVQLFMPPDRRIAQTRPAIAAVSPRSPAIISVLANC